MSEDAPQLGGPPPDGLLPCGRSTDDLLEQVAAGRADHLDAHQTGCVHCRAALAEIARLWAPVRALAGVVETPPARLLDGVMRSVRELARDVWHVVVPDERGSTRIAARVVADIAQRAAAGVPGVRVALGRHSGGPQARRAAAATRTHEPEGGAVGVAGRHATIDLAVVVGYGARISDVVAGIRSRVAADLARMAAVESAEVNISVDDVLPPVPGGPPAAV